ncbi:MAG: YIP1 family protein [Sedimenticola thiotaurini]|uniref:YIP1 family protein n=1 Tax=Sedimenticola thiotaurini TaxID=1543721 RepID=A0A558DG67_9GAMM|nr:MAG: YIP1 family protein [Sedimenticola thiotaurini]
MVISPYARMIFSSHAGWEDVERVHPSVITLFLFLVLPMSFVPPAMILYAGFDYGGNYFEAASGATWVISSLVFLVAELITVPLMAWAIKSIAGTRRIRTEYRDTFAVASIAAMPMWFSSIALFVPNPAFVIGMVLIGLLVSISLVYHGIAGMMHLHEEVEVSSITYTTICLGIVTWMFLITLVFLPLL